MSASELCFKTATELAQDIRAKKVSSTEVMEAHLDQIERVNPQVNAIVTLLPREQCLALAKEADNALANGKSNHLGPLHGLPTAHKDLVNTKGIRTTKGSPIYADNVPDQDALIVERMKKGGMLTIGKTNTPEFGAGAQTYNEVFGETHNPYDLGKTCGGSSGGAAVSLACGMLPACDGSDTGGSLRNPGGFNNVVGFRTSPGRVPVWPAQLGWWPISVQGPMARTVADVALLLSVMAGPDARCPIAVAEPGDVFRKPLDRKFQGTQIAWSPDLGGLPMESRVRDVLESKRGVFAELGCELSETAPDFTDADEVFQVLRAWRFEMSYSELLKTKRDMIKDTVIWNTEYGMKLTGPQVARAEEKRTEIYHRVREFLEKHEFLVCATNTVAPFDISQRYLDEIEGVKLPTYIDWMKSCWYITITGLPAITVPCGFTPEGLPVGIQIVGRHQDEFGVLQLAHAFEQATRVYAQRPAVAS